LAGAAGQGPQRGTLVPSPAAASPTPVVVTLTEMATAPDPQDANQTRGPSAEPAPGDKAPKTIKISLSPGPKEPQAAGGQTGATKAGPANGEELLTLTLPETITLIQLLDLVGKHVGLNYVYDPKEIGNQPIALKLHGKLQGEMRIKNLYALLETVLGFMNLAMIRQDDNLVAVVPIEKALQTRPELIDVEANAVHVGDTVVTRVFEIQHADVASVMTLLQTMQLSVAATPLDNSNLLLVTCHADRMHRIEELVALIDQPGRPPECRFRRLSYVRATPLIAKIRALAGELKGITIATSSVPARPPAAGRVAAPAEHRSVYLDADERTNRVLMIGLPAELTLLEELIDILDVAQEDPARRTSIRSGISAPRRPWRSSRNWRCSRARPAVPLPRRPARGRL